MAENASRRRVAGGSALALAGLFGREALSFLSDLHEVQGMTVGAVHVPAEFAILILQYALITVGLSLIAPALVNSLRSLAGHIHSRHLSKSKATAILRCLPLQELEEMETLIPSHNCANEFWLKDAISNGLVELVSEGRTEIFGLRPGVGKALKRELRRRRRADA